MSEYDPVLSTPPARFARDREQVETLFERAAGPYLRSPWGWFAWSLALPAASLSTGAMYSRRGASGVLLLWSLTILLAGLVEAAPHLRLRKEGVSPLATWALRGQANLSAVGVALSALLLWLGEPGALPGLWLLLLGHSFFLLGGLAFRPLRACGLLYQAAGLLALWPRMDSMWVLAGATFLGNFGIGWRVLRGSQTD
ncbi:MAG: hypothetical protein ABI609_17835 [Acidobacteriota bacterium]